MNWQISTFPVKEMVIFDVEFDRFFLKRIQIFTIHFI